MSRLLTTAVLATMAACIAVTLELRWISDALRTIEGAERATRAEKDMQEHSTEWQSVRGREIVRTPRLAEEGVASWQARHDQAVSEAQAKWPPVG